MIRKRLTYQLMKLRPKGVVLMYHRIAEPKTDAWELCVSPENFRAQLQVLKKFTPVSLEKLVQKRRSWIPRQHVAITFDDGYIDNYTQAAPLLDEAKVPASFFISSGYTGTDRWFWWDALEYLLLQQPVLPSRLSVNTGKGEQSLSLEGEEQLTQDLAQQLKDWQAELPPPGRRAEAYLALWQLCQKENEKEQNAILQQLFQQTNISFPQERLCMQAGELQALQAHPLFSVEAHTLSHPMLANCSQQDQQKEIAGSRDQLTHLTDYTPQFFSYPYGNYNTTAYEVAASTGFQASFTTEAELVRSWSDLHLLGRFMVKNWTAEEFEYRLKAWFKGENV